MRRGIFLVIGNAYRLIEFIIKRPTNTFLIFRSCTSRILVLLALFITNIQSLHAQFPNDCSEVITVCSDASLLFNSPGPGEDDFANANNNSGCLLRRENQSLWLKVPIVADGTFGFTIKPIADDDYDFAIFGPAATCGNLGFPIRCSFALPLNSIYETGLRNAVGDTSEDELGDGFVNTIDAKAGEEYYILIDNFESTSSGFNLDFFGTAQISNAPSIPSVQDQEICDLDKDGKEVFDLSTLTPLISNANPVSVTFHSTENEAILNEGALATDFNASGDNQIFFRVTSNNTNCFSIGSFKIKFREISTGMNLTGGTSVCPNEEVTYTVSGGDAAFTYQWSVIGGEILNGQGTDLINVRWGNSDNNASVNLVPKSSDGCIGDTLNLNVVVNQKLVPQTPQGPTELCLTSLVETTYSVPFSSSSTYEWFVKNGTIIGSGTGNEVKVRWNGDVDGEIYLKELNTKIAPCPGESQILAVAFYPEVSSTVTVDNVSCFGESNGSIDLLISGGAGPYQVEWDDGFVGVNRNNLPAGNYNYTIRDSKVCVISGSANITQPTGLEIDSISPSNVFCFQDNNGNAQIAIRGGVAPYDITWFRSGVEVIGDNTSIENLSAGDYEVLVVDANNCDVSGTFQITEPDLLEVDLGQLVNTPICPKANDGFITIGAQGGTPDYEFIWEVNPTQSGNTIEGLTTGLYTVRIIDRNNCEATYIAELSERNPKVIVPDAFSPNGDDRNDVFQAVATCPPDVYKMMIYNRWGEIIFNTSSIDEAWDGTYRGEDLTTGQYTYMISYQFVLQGNIIEETIRGRFMLMR